MFPGNKPTLSDMLAYVKNLTDAKLKECKAKGCTFYFLRAAPGDVIFVPAGCLLGSITRNRSAVVGLRRTFLPKMTIEKDIAPSLAALEALVDPIGKEPDHDKESMKVKLLIDVMGVKQLKVQKPILEFDSQGERAMPSPKTQRTS